MSADMEPRDEGDRIAHALAGSALGIWDWNMQTGATVFNERWAEIVGYTLEELAPASIDTWVALVHPDDLSTSDAAIAAHAAGETPFYDVIARMRHHDGHWVWVRDRGRIVEWDAEGKPLRMVGTHEDMTQRMADEQARLELVQRVDPLTGLANRSALLVHLSEMLSEYPAPILTLFLIDLDRFTAVNDSYGHATGDAMLVEVARRLHDVDGGHVYRIGSDEFGVLCDGLNDLASAANIAGAMTTVLQLPFIVPDGGEVFLSSCIGFASTDARHTSADLLMQRADAALDDAKRAGPGSVRHHLDSLVEQTRSRLDLESRLRKSWAAREFAVQYQPQIDIATGEVIGVEALLRWTPADGRAMPPSVFIPAAEEIGLIGDMGDWVLREACKQAREWLDAGVPPLMIAVNISARQLARGDVPAAVVTAAAEYGVSPDRIEIEITESSLLEGGDVSIDLLADLRGTGVGLAVDDFGTGYSSFGYIQRFRMNTLKIDRMFIEALDRTEQDRAICSVIITLGHALGMTVLAEGVETQSQLDVLAAQGCDRYQGFLASPALDPDEVGAFVARRATTHG